MTPLNVAWAIPDSQAAAEIQTGMRGLPVRVVCAKEGFEAFFRQIDAIRCDVALVQASGDQVRDYVARIKALPEPPMVIVIGGSADAAEILAAFHAGADEYVYPPFAENLRKAMERESARRREVRGRILGFLSVKGGCGGTTLACGTALELARRQPRVLLLDLDANAGMAGFLTGAAGPGTTLDVMRHAGALDQDRWDALVSEGPAGLHVVPAPDVGGPHPDFPVEHLRAALRFVRPRYEWTIADLGSCLTGERLPLCEEVDVLYLVTTEDVMALYRAVQALQGLEKSGVPRTGLRALVRRADGPAVMTREEMERVLGVAVEAAFPEDRRAVARWHAGEHEALAAGPLGRALAEFVSAITGKAPATPPRGGSRWRSALRALQPSRGDAW